MHHAGSGIGLALVKAFVELHKGTISVESDEKQGTVFTVDLPVQTCETILAEDSLKSSISAVPLNPASPRISRLFRPEWNFSCRRRGTGKRL